MIINVDIFKSKKPFLSHSIKQKEKYQIVVGIHEPVLSIC